ncbi:hypothetical protein LINPERHAP1_LOCUS37855 [Linum perenne]
MAPAPAEIGEEESRSVSLEPDHAAANNTPAFIDDIDSVSLFPPLREDGQSTLVNSLSQFNRWPSHAPNPNPDHPIHKSSSTQFFREAANLSGTDL